MLASCIVMVKVMLQSCGQSNVAMLQNHVYQVTSAVDYMVSKFSVVVCIVCLYIVTVSLWFEQSED
jgi:hypothetical protein